MSASLPLRRKPKFATLCNIEASKVCQRGFGCFKVTELFSQFFPNFRTFAFQTNQNLYDTEEQF